MIIIPRSTILVVFSTPFSKTKLFEKKYRYEKVSTDKSSPITPALYRLFKKGILILWIRIFA
jgi:hypothetical protein